MRKLYSLSVALMLALGAAAWAQATMPQAGDKAPNFTLTATDGKQVTLSKLHGQWVVLYFYPADGTPGCTMEAHNFQQDLDKFKALHAVILGVSAQDVASHKKFTAAQDLHFELLADPDQKVINLYGDAHNYGGQLGTLANRTTFLIDPSGKIVKVFTKVNPRVHSAEVQDALKAAQADK